MVIDWSAFFWLGEPFMAASPVIVWSYGSSGVVPPSNLPEIWNQASINNYEPRSIALPGTITVGGGFQL